MRTSRAALIVFILISWFSTGCLMRRTITQGNEVVAEGYVVKPPLAPLVAE